MARTKKEVEAFLNSLVGDKVNAKCGIYNGQCVSLPKALFEFLGVPDPYAARGNAKDVGDTLLRQNIAENGKGWLTVVINKSMGNIGGVNYGHIWLDLQGIANYEQNGAVALHTTKNTRPLSQGQQFVNLDKWIKGEDTVDNTWKREARRIAFLLYLERGISPDEYNDSDGAKTPGAIYAQVAKSAEAFRKWKEIATKLGVVVTDTQIKAWQQDWQGQAPGKTLHRLVKGGDATPTTKADVIEYINKNLK